jgi:RimJ/RimL family protein N-acetyltransferase
MNDIQTSISGLTLIRPDADRDASFALSWFEPPHGKETLILMGNPEHKITTPTLKEETDRIHEFLKLKKENRQLTWMIRYDDKTIGAVWLGLSDTEYVKSPAFHIMIGAKSYRGRGFGRAIMQEMINYAKNILKTKNLYSRHLVSNEGITRLNKSLGFVKDGETYIDTDGLEFQNIRLEF